MNPDGGAGNLFADIPGQLPAELVQQLAAGGGCRLERIVSRGQVTPPGQWYDQDWDEWVVLLSGAARLRLQAPDKVMELKPGDYILLPAHRLHRVDWTPPETDSVWLALHFDANQPGN